MTITEIQSRLEQDLQELKLDEKKTQLKELEDKSMAADFWSNQEDAKTVMKQIESLKTVIEKWDAIATEVESLVEIQPLLKEDEDLAKDAQVQLVHLEKTLSSAEIQLLFTGDYDASAAYVHFAPGAGGTESKDFAEMLLRMYLRWAEKNGYSATIVSKKAGEEAGIDSATIKLEGPYAYGYLKGESGVHRLIRISPFNAQGLRQTSFVAIETMPEIPDTDTNFDIPDKELRIDTYRASGAGGQAVNKTDSAVRITHIPTGIVATCQDERSQLQNRAQAMSVLKAKLATLMLEQHAQKVSEIKPDHKKIEFGSQIRTYTLQPYTLVKDHRTNQEVTDAASVLDGDLEVLLESGLRGRSL